MRGVLGAVVAPNGIDPFSALGKSAVLASRREGQKRDTRAAIYRFQTIIISPDLKLNPFDPGGILGPL